MIYDCFTFFNELDILEIRLNILKNVVDKFVLVEATRTHQGKEKPLYFSENKARYKEFEDKIIHIVIDEYPPYEGKSAWVLERYQRDMIAKDGRIASKMILYLSLT
jgi:beta-1,4-mannosyl-glycoprotein beta-1,4-N-acetylglucosaminyltransferase